VERILLDGDLESNLLALEPLTVAAAPRELVMETRNQEWVALLDCGVPVDHRTPTMHLCGVLDARGVVVTSIPDAKADRRTPERFGARQFIMFGPEGNHFLNYERSISVARDGSKWRFDANGPVQPFENVEAYGARRVADRLTSSMLVAYASAMGLAPFDEGFYAGRATMIVNPSISPSPTLSYAQAQALGCKADRASHRRLGYSLPWLLSLIRKVAIDRVASLMWPQRSRRDR
jgi:hypothetical protein